GAARAGRRPADPGRAAQPAASGAVSQVAARRDPPPRRRGGGLRAAPRPPRLEAGAAMSAIAFRFWVSGRVQGVGFRWYVRRAAQELGLAGRVRNLPDGRVEAEAAGEPEALNAFRARLREGPPGARVTRLEEE